MAGVHVDYPGGEGVRGRGRRGQEGGAGGGREGVGGTF